MKKKLSKSSVILEKDKILDSRKIMLMRFSQKRKIKHKTMTGIVIGKVFFLNVLDLVMNSLFFYF
jgi:hypothetical protein